MSTRKTHKRRAYTRKDGTKVRACTVRGGKVLLPVPKKGDLGRYKYRVNDTVKNREMALRRMVKKPSKKKALKNLRALVVLRSLNKKRPKLHKKLDRDVKYAQKLYKEKKR